MYIVINGTKHPWSLFTLPISKVNDTLNVINKIKYLINLFI